jgi:hypothetical protein
MLRRVFGFLTNDLPALEGYRIAAPAAPVRPVSKNENAKSGLADNQHIEFGKVWTKTREVDLDPTVHIEFTASAKATATTAGLDTFDLQALGAKNRFGVDKGGAVKCDELQASRVKGYKFQGMSIDDVVKLHTISGVVEKGYSRSNIAKYFGAFSDAQAERQSKTVQK